MTDRLLQEDGGLLLQEDGSAILLDVAPPYVPPPPPVYFPTTLADALRGGHTYATRVTFRNADLTRLFEVDTALVEGSVQSDRKRHVRFTGSLSLVNELGLFTPASPASFVWPGRVVRIERGALLGNTAQLAPLMTGLIGSPSVTREGTVTFDLRGRLDLADQQFSDAIVFGARTRLRDMVRALCELAGMGTADELYVLDDGQAVLNADRGFDASENMLRAMVELVEAFGLELYDDALGRVVLRPFPDPAETDPAWDFGPGVLTALTDLERTLQGRRVYNRVRARSIAPDGYPRYAEARDTNPLSPTYWTPDYDRPSPLVEVAESLGQADLLAYVRRLLIEGATTDEVGRGQAYPIPLVAAGDVVTADGQRVLLDTVTMPLRGGEMAFEYRTARSLV
jgi:hypothetical protein